MPSDPTKPLLRLTPQASVPRELGPPRPIPPTRPVQHRAPARADTCNTALVLMEALQAGPVRFELAARHEWQRIETVLNHIVTHNSLSVSCGRNFVFGLRTVF